MTVQDLITQLEQYPADTPVYTNDYEFSMYDEVSRVSVVVPDGFIGTGIVIS